MDPNYIKGIGRLSTDEYDFKKHVNGESEKHKANGLVLFPPITITAVAYADVQSAIAALSAAVAAPISNDATTSVKGIIKLGGDLANGTAAAPIVTGLQGFPVSTLTPTIDYVLKWTGATWESSISPSVFSAATDLAGSNVSQTVIGITGFGTPPNDLVNIICNKLTFIEAITAPALRQLDNTTGAGVNLAITAQASTFATSNGGNVIISGGSSSGGKAGGVFLGIDTSYFIQGSKLSGRVLALVSNAAITATEMPASTGDMVVYVKNAVTNPTASPVSGAILYASSGVLKAKQADGIDFEIGELRDPSIAGSTGQMLYTTRVYYTSTGTTADTVLTYPIPDTTIVSAYVMYVGKESSSANALKGDISKAYIRNGGAPVGGALQFTNDDIFGAATGWTPPTISSSGNNLIVLAGAPPSAVSINWFMVIRLQIVSTV